MYQDVPQSVWRIVNVSLFRTTMQCVPSGDDNQSLLNQYASLELYNMIY